MAQATVFLFDVDGTLVTTAGAGRAAIVAAFERLFGRPDAFDGVRFGGMTDRAIVRGGLEVIGREATAERIEEVIAEYLSGLRDAVAAADSRYRVHDGVIATLDALKDLPDCATGLGTGNVEHGARIKLERVAINHYFSFGGYGSDDEDRARLLERGAQRGAQRLQCARDRCRVVVIGDTPRDVEAAHAIGAVCVAVATGGASFDELAAAGAEHVFKSLQDAEAQSVLLAAAVTGGAL